MIENIGPRIWRVTTDNGKISTVCGGETEAEALAIYDLGLLPPPLTSADFAAAIQSHVDATAKYKGYSDGVALAGYSTSTIQTWAAEAQTFIAWRDQVWLYAYTELAKVQGGQREVPTIAGLIAELPMITWPGAS